MKYILASASPRRSELLKLITSDFTVACSGVDESTPRDIKPELIPEYLAVRKAKAVARDMPEAVVIGADTAVFINGRILGKPIDAEEAAKMLLELSGKTHEVITGCAVCRGESCTSFSSVTRVTFFDFDRKAAEDYIKTGEPMDKAGAYGIQGKGALLVKKIEGDYFSVVGLPVARLANALKGIEEKWK